MNHKQTIAVICLLSICLRTQVSAKVVVTDSLCVGKTVAMSPAELIRGEVSGARVSSIDGNPNGAFNVNIRGLNTLRGDSQPLWIVDGAVIGSSVNHNLNAFYLNGGFTTKGDVLPDYSGRSYTSPVSSFGWLNPGDIASIEVIKDLSAAALYGMSGANGVIVIKTKRTSSTARNIWLSSHVGVDFSSEKGDAFRTGVNHMQKLGVNGSIGNNSYYNISGFLHQNNAAVKCTNSIVGGLAANFETMANKVFKFGLNTNLSYGKLLSTGGANYIGAPSTMISARYPDLFPDDKVAGWLDSYDDEVLDYRVVNSVWLQVDIIHGLNLRMTGGMDYQNQSRYIWFGDGTSFGKDFSGAAGILNNFLFAYNAKGELNFNRNFAVKHRLKASLAFDLKGNMDKTNAMCGTDFDLPFLRGKGLSASASQHAIRRFDRKYSQWGAYAYVGYDFDGYAGISAAARFDKTGRFESNPTFFPAVDAYVDFKRLLLANNKAVSSLKIIGGYGEAGHETVLPYEFLANYISNVPEVETGTELYFDGINRLISKEYNVGFNIGFMNDRFNLALKYYDKKTDDNFKICNFGKVLAGLWVETANWSVLEERCSAIENKGFEIDVDFRIIQHRNVVWTLYANASFNTNSVASLHELDRRTPGLTNGKYTAANEEGKSVSQAYGRKSDKRGEVASADLDILGNTLPEYAGGLGTTPRLYGLTVDARFSAAGGFNIINANKLVEKGRDYISSDDLEKGDYLRLDCLCFSYDIPVRAKWIKDFKVNLAVRNLFTIFGYSGWNPDVNSFGVTVRGNGVDYGSFPLIRSVALGVSLKF